MLGNIGDSNRVDQTAHAQETHKVRGAAAPFEAAKPKGSFSSLAELKEMDPEAYDALLKATANQMITKSEKDNERLKKLMKEGNQS